jgi:AraC family transcriptional regulator
MPVQPRLLNLSTFINEHLREDLTLEVLAQRMNLSPFHFHRKFRAYFGESLHQHIKRLRLERSAYSLLYRLTPVSTVAKNSGYKTLSAFSHAFSAHFGVAPTRFRDVMMKGRLATDTAAVRERLQSMGLAALEPARIDTVQEKSIAFLRAEITAPGAAEAVCLALDEWQSLSSGAPAAAPEARGEMFVSTVDLFGLLTGSSFRIDIGREMHAGDTQRAMTGTATLPRGRYAIFEFRCPPERVIDVVQGVYHVWLPDSKQAVRPQVNYLSFTRDGERELRFTLYVPLEEVAALAGNDAALEASVPEAAHS